MNAPLDGSSLSGNKSGRSKISKTVLNSGWRFRVPGVTHHLDYPRELAHGHGESSQEIRTKGHHGLEATTRRPCQPLEVAVTTLRDIEPGEELCFSYISESLRPAARKHALREYGIEI